MKWSLNWRVTAGFAAALVILGVAEVISYQSTNHLVRTSQQIAHTRQVLQSLDEIVVTMDDAEIGERGYLLTGKEIYLQPYQDARDRLPKVLTTLDELTPYDSDRQRKLEELTRLIIQKQQELAAAIAMKTANKTDEASWLVMSGLGKKEMDDIRALIARMRKSEDARLANRTGLWEAGARRTTHVVILGVAVASIFLLTAILALNSETSERSRAEKALRKTQARAKMLADSIPDYAILMLDIEGRVLSWSSGARKILGYQEEEVLGQSYSRFSPPGDASAGVPIQELEKVTVNGRVEAEGWRMRKDGSCFWANSVMVAIRDDKGQLHGFSKVIRDVTEQKAAREKIEKLNQDLEQRANDLEAANKELEAFTYSVSHDLRAPLRHINGFSRLLLDEYGAQMPGEVRRYLDRIQRGARQMGQLVDELLNLSRIGRREMTLQVTGLDTVVEQVVSDLKMESGGRKVDWKIASLPYVECDPMLMKQVFANLLSNALKYTRPRDPAIIEVGTVQDNGIPAIYVRDNGVGFSMKYADKLFGVFQRLHREEDFEGTGIGLATVQRIIHKHGGRIWAQAELDKGAIFYFTLGSQTA